MSGETSTFAYFRYQYLNNKPHNAMFANKLVEGVVI